MKKFLIGAATVILVVIVLGVVFRRPVHQVFLPFGSITLSIDPRVWDYALPNKDNVLTLQNIDGNYSFTALMSEAYIGCSAAGDSV